ncbi:MAG: Na(+)-translocating NADH-quinone reductase subunit A [Bacteroidales bacterium]|jgi:Na+-transporting NADH:ubiquinone oxidoreductase subunit A|nr:Na(+)-translocating NADH-quinone reductase subunit A [Bacteroidales bacterium]
MASLIKLNKGLDINLAGAAEQKLVSVKAADKVTLVPDDFVGSTPKVVVKAGEAVKAGDVLFTDKLHPEIKFVSPVSGTVEEVVRGERRKVLGVVVVNDGKGTSVELPAVNPTSASADEIKSALLNAGVWPFIKQRPYNVVANPEVQPRDIFVTAMDTAPLAPDFAFVVKGQEEDLQRGISALAKLTAGKVYVGAKAGSKLQLNNAEVVEFAGPHPAGNVGVQINHIKPLNKGEQVWTVSAFDVIVMGRALAGKVDFTRTITVAGSEVVSPAYAKVLPGQTLASILDGNVKHVEYTQRYIAGNVLTGQNAGKEGVVGFFDNTVTVIPDGGDTDELFGWITPGLNRYSTSNTGLSGLFGLFKSKKWTLDARLKGGPRALIVSGTWEKVFPMDIYPEELYKAVLTYNIDKMEALGIYEVAPEDFALCEFVDASKTPVQQVIADGLVKLRKEME